MATKKKAAAKTQARPKKSAGYRGEKGKGGTTKKSGFPKKYPGQYTGKKTAKKTAKKSPTKKKFPSIQDYLMGDEYYQQGLSDLEWALEQFLIENDAAEGDLGASFGSAMGYMNLDKEKALEYMKDDYGARGLVFSGLYPEAVSDYNKEWSMGVADLNRDLASQMRDLGFEEQNMRQSTEMQKRDLRLDAIRRRKEDIQQSQFSNKAGFGTKKKAPAKKAPAKKSAAKGKGRRYTPKSGVRKTGKR
jgi:hypothetical protein